MTQFHTLPTITATIMTIRVIAVTEDPQYDSLKLKKLFSEIPNGNLSFWMRFSTRIEKCGHSEGSVLNEEIIKRVGLAEDGRRFVYEFQVPLNDVAALMNRDAHVAIESSYVVGRPPFYSLNLCCLPFSIELLREIDDMVSVLSLLLREGCLADASWQSPSVIYQILEPHDVTLTEPVVRLVEDLSYQFYIRRCLSPESVPTMKDVDPFRLVRRMVVGILSESPISTTGRGTAWMCDEVYCDQRLPCIICNAPFNDFVTLIEMSQELYDLIKPSLERISEERGKAQIMSLYDKALAAHKGYTTAKVLRIMSRLQ